MLRPPPSGLAGAVIALVAIFLPGMLLVYGILPFLDAMRILPSAQAAMRGANAAVVGSQGNGTMDIIAPLMLWAIVIAMVMFAVMAAKQ